MVSIILGTCFLFLGNNQDSAEGRFEVIFFSLVNTATAGSAVIASILEERAVFYREYSSGYYRVIAYLKYKKKEEEEGGERRRRKEEEKEENK